MSGIISILTHISIQGGSGYAKNIRFENIAMDNVANPIIIDQNYCDKKKPCGQQVIEHLCTYLLLAYLTGHDQLLITMID